MTRHAISTVKGLVAGFITSWLVMFGHLPSSVTKADCPSLPNYQGWAPNSLVIYLGGGSFPAAESDQIDSAFSNWTLNNQLPLIGNCSGVAFTSGVLTPGPGFYVISNANDFSLTNPECGGNDQR